MSIQILESRIFEMDAEIKRLTAIRDKFLALHRSLTRQPTYDDRIGFWEDLHSKLAARQDRQYYQTSTPEKAGSRQPSDKKIERDFVIAEECWRRMGGIR